MPETYNEGPGKTRKNSIFKYKHWPATAPTIEKSTESYEWWLMPYEWSFLSCMFHCHSEGFITVGT